MIDRAVTDLPDRTRRRCPSDLAGADVEADVVDGLDVAAPSVNSVRRPSTRSSGASCPLTGATVRTVASVIAGSPPR